MCLLFLLLLPFIASAQQLTIKLSTEYGGYYRPGDWYPVIVSIENKPKQGSPGDRSLDFAGQLIVQSTSDKSRYAAFEYRRDVQVPAFSTQRFTLLVKFPEQLSLVTPTLEVRAKNGRLLSTYKIEVQPLRKSQRLLVTASEEVRRIGYPAPKQGQVNSMTRATMPSRNLPESWASYDPVDILVFPQWPAAELSAKRQKALEDWVTMGGTLVFLGGANSNTYGGAEGNLLLPVQTSGSSQYRWNEKNQTLALAPEGSTNDTLGVLVSDLKVEPGSEVLYEAGNVGTEVPVLVRKRLGRGQILFLSVDLESMPLDFRNRLLPYWLGVMDTPNMVGWEYSLHKVRDSLRVVKQSTARPPNPVLIILLCILYTAIVGPVNFFILNKRNRIQWAWFTVPVIVLLFSGLIYTIGTLTKGTQSIAREVSLLTGYEGQNRFEDRSYVGVFTHKGGTFYARPADESHTVSDSERWTQVEGIYPSNYLQGDYTGSLTPNIKSEHPAFASSDDGVTVARWPLETFDTTVFERRGPVELDGPVASTVTYRNSDVEHMVWLEGKLTNETGMDFYATGLFFGDRMLPLEKMASGESIQLNKELTVRPYVRGTGPQGKSNWKGLSRGSATDMLADPPGDESDADFNRSNADLLLAGLFAPADTYFLMSPMKGLYFVGLAEADDLTIDTNMERDMGTRSIVTIVRLNPLPGQDTFYVPGQFVQMNLQDYQSDPARLGLESMAGENAVELREGWAIYSFRLPFEGAKIRPTVVTPNLIQAKNDTNLILASGIYENARAQFLTFGANTNVPRENVNDLVSPISGSGWFSLSGSRPPEGQNRGIASDSIVLTRFDADISGTAD